ncbi:hypothetical protein [Kosmotoga olearia]|uniref:Uncharacterized protein n=1 Tax=Kosmotoga olearia (strain ATCC BAA-1733 / DSM 21960 / TBF 19.5.1) TaxID=521045 RepID=C5CDN3_KOSOT|nr:hypothetical protein [Kosmotoga olearia]ACR80045.1 hypothetical protein Kole_1351 [Kosmotoga olearia TBF 19.5.1]
MKRSSKIMLFIGLIAVVIVLIYFLAIKPITINVSVIFPNAAKGNPTIKVSSSIEEIQLSKNSPSASIRVKGKDTIKFSTLEGVVLQRKDFEKGMKELTYTFPEPKISEFTYKLSEEAPEVTLHWSLDKGPYNIRGISLERNGITISRENRPFVDKVADFQGKNVSYQLIAEFEYGPVSIDVSKVVTIDVPKYPVEVRIMLKIPQGLSRDMVKVSLDDMELSPGEDNTVVFKSVSQGKHSITLSYGKVELLKQEAVFDWNNGLPYLMNYSLPVISITKPIVEKLKGEKLKVSWSSTFEDFDAANISYKVKIADITEVTTTTEMVIEIPAEDSILSISPCYFGVVFGKTQEITVRGKPRLEIKTISKYSTATEVTIPYIAKNVETLSMKLDNSEKTQLEPTSGFVKFVGLDEGLHEVELKAVGIYGESLIATTSFIVDTIPPNEPEVVDVKLGKGVITLILGPLSSDVSKITGYVKVTDELIHEVELEVFTETPSVITIPVPENIEGFDGILEVSLLAEDFAGNVSQVNVQKVSIVDFEELFKKIEFSINQKDYEPVNVQIKTHFVSPNATLTVYLDSPKGSFIFEYPLAEELRVEEKVEGVYFGKMQLSYQLNVAGVKSPTILATETEVTLKELKNFRAFQTTEDGNFRVEFVQLPDPEIRYVIKRKITNTRYYQDIRTVEPIPLKEGEPLPTLKVDFDSPFEYTDDSTLLINVEVIVTGKDFETKFTKKDIPLFKGATIVTGKFDKEFVYDSNAMPILFTGFVQILPTGSIKIRGNGEILIQDGASIEVRGSLEIAGTTDGLKFENLSTGEVLLLPGSTFKASNIYFNGETVRLYGLGSNVTIENAAFEHGVVPISMAAGSDLTLKNVKFKDLRTAIYLEKPRKVALRDIEIINAENGVIINQPTESLEIVNFKATDRIRGTAIKLKNALDIPCSLENIEISTGDIALELEKVSSAVINNGKLNARNFAIVIGKSVFILLKNIVVSGDVENGEPYIGILISNSGALIADSEIKNCRQDGIYIQNVDLPQPLQEQYEQLEDKEKPEWAPVEIVNVKFDNELPPDGYDVYIDGTYDVVIHDIPLEKLKYLDGRIQPYWFDGLRYQYRGVIKVK